MTMRTFWAVMNPYNDGLFLAGHLRPSIWTRREEEAERFTSEDAALNTIISQLNGKGRAVQVTMLEAYEAAL